MKKLTPTFEKWLRNRRRRQSGQLRRKKNRVPKAHIVQAWYGGEIENVVSENLPKVPPSILCFEKNSAETLRFLDGWRNSFRSIKPSEAHKKFEWFKAPKSGGSKRRITSYSDFSQISELSASAALILTAEYDRVAHLIGDVPPTINLDEWDTTVFRSLFEIGFFEVLKLSQDVADQYVTSGDVKTMRIVSGSNASELALASSGIQSLSAFIDEESPISEDVEVALNNALSEAMINVSKHAYPDDHEFRYRHIDKWWVTASADRVKRVLTIVIYDQGASIPVTFPKKTLSKSVLDYLTSALRLSPEFEFENDGAYIEGAMMPGKSQTGQSFRGLGLPEMKDLVDICGDGSLRIFSRGGECYYRAGDRLERHSRQESAGGTLIEWKLFLPKGE